MAWRTFRRPLTSSCSPLSRSVGLTCGPTLRQISLSSLIPAALCPHTHSGFKSTYGISGTAISIWLYPAQHQRLLKVARIDLRLQRIYSLLLAPIYSLIWQALKGIKIYIKIDMLINAVALSLFLAGAIIVSYGGVGSYSSCSRRWLCGSGQVCWWLAGRT